MTKILMKIICQYGGPIFFPLKGSMRLIQIGQMALNN